MIFSEYRFTLALTRPFGSGSCSSPYGIKSMSCKLTLDVLGAIARVSALNVCAPPLLAQSIEEKTQACAGCHGADGKPIDKTIPIIWGQQAGYLYIQLRDFKRGDRKSDIMQP